MAAIETISEEPIDAQIGVTEEVMQTADTVDVYQYGDCTVMTIDGRPYCLPRDVATQLAWDLCAQLQQ